LGRTPARARRNPAREKSADAHGEGATWETLFSMNEERSREPTIAPVYYTVSVVSPNNTSIVPFRQMSARPT
jgi:hypothetical protein